MDGHPNRRIQRPIPQETRSCQRPPMLQKQRRKLGGLHPARTQRQHHMGYDLTAARNARYCILVVTYCCWCNPAASAFRVSFGHHNNIIQANYMEGQYARKQKRHIYIDFAMSPRKPPSHIERGILSNVGL